MPYYDEIFKHVTAEFPHALAVLALNEPEVEVGDRLATEHTTVRMHHSDILMKYPPDMTPQAWVEKCIETTQAVDVDSKMQATLLLALSLFGSLVHPPELFQDPLLEAIMQESPFYDLVIQRGIEQGARQMSIESTLATLNQRFPNADVDALKPILEAIDDLNRLRELNLNASIAESFNTFRERLNALS